TKEKIKNPHMFLLRELDDIQVKGKTRPVKIFEVVRTNKSSKESLLSLVTHFESGLHLYRKQAWQEAKSEFETCLQLFPADGPAQEFIRRCNYLEEHAPENNWDGVWVMNTK